jgi:acetylglutamate kinase
MDVPKIMQEAIQKSGVLIEALPYIKKFFGKIVVIKYGGAAVDEKGIDRGILEDIMFMNYAGMHPVVVHGGGPYISRMMKKAGLEPRFIQGRRYTDDAAIRIIDQALHVINRKIVTELKAMGARAFGLSGRENDLIKVRKLSPGYDLGLVGEVTSVDATVVKSLLKDNMLPVIYPLGQGPGGRVYNVNADDVASAIAAKLKAEKFVLLTNVMGVMKDRHDPKTLYKTLTTEDVHRLIAQKIIDSGMVPKVEACVNGVGKGVKKAHILDAAIPHGMLLEIFTDTGIGTEIVK